MKPLQGLPFSKVFLSKNNLHKDPQPLELCFPLFAPSLPPVVRQPSQEAAVASPPTQQTSQVKLPCTGNVICRVKMHHGCWPVMVQGEQYRRELGRDLLIRNNKF